MDTQHISLLHKGGKTLDKELTEIIRKALEAPNPSCPKCNVEGVVKGWGEIAWCECPKCKGKIGDLTVM